jgi:uncharacterized membrane protein YhaH (DUF805 family)
MKFSWWESLAMFALFAIQFILPAFIGEQVRIWITAAFFVWTAVGILAMVFRRCRPAALDTFIETWRAHVP